MVSLKITLALGLLSTLMLPMAASVDVQLNVYTNATTPIVANMTTPPTNMTTPPPTLNATIAFKINNETEEVYVSSEVAEASNTTSLTVTSLSQISAPLTCASGLRQFDVHRHKPVYRVGVFASSGFDAAREDYDILFQDYLTATAGQRFDKSIKFQMIPTTFQGLYEAVENEHIDFFFANPGVFSCMGVEVGAQPLATAISRMEIRGHVYDLDQYGGVIMTQRGNREIETIEDLKDKVIAAGGISMILAGQVQFYQMEKAGLSWVMDPKQIVFTGNQEDVVLGVLNGDYDVGFVRTGQIEQTQLPNGDFVNPDDFKVLSPRIHIMDDGALFPFLHSTDIYPESPISSLSHTPSDVVEEVQAALLALGDHAEIGEYYEACRHGVNKEDCASIPATDINPGARCDTSYDLANLARLAAKNASLAGFRTTRSYFQARTMQEAAGFLTENEDGEWKCARSATLYESLHCPAGHLKRNQDEFNAGCNQTKLNCTEGHRCFCRPCIYEVDLYQVFDGMEDEHLTSEFRPYPGGCEKDSVCGTAQQREPITLRIYDNMAREGAEVRALYSQNRKAYDIDVRRVRDSWAYDFTFAAQEVGEVKVEVFIDGDSIPVSPVTVQITERSCDHGRVASIDGNCVCGSGSISFASVCADTAVFFVSVCSIVLLALFACGLWYLEKKRQQADELWQVDVDELKMDEPAEVIGQGGFGVVLLAEYRGTKVAIKRVLPQKGRKNLESIRSGSLVELSMGSAFSNNSHASKGMTIDHSDSTPRDVENPAPAGSKGALASIEGEPKIGHSMSSFGAFVRKLHTGSPNSKWARWLPIRKSNRTKATSVNHSVFISSHSARSSTVVMWMGCLRKENRRRKDFIEEMRLLSRLRHPCITTVIGAVMSPYYEPMLVMEYMEYGSLYDLLRNETMYLSGEIILQVVRDITQGIRYLHASKPPITHGDLKARNILIDSRFRAKVCDFGLSTKKKHCLSGSPFWLAPEYLQGTSEYNPACDMYSLGVIFFEIYARTVPYEGENPRRVLLAVCDNRKHKRPGVPPQCPPKVANIMKRCWAADPSARPIAKDLDMLLTDITASEAEPLSEDQQTYERPTGDMMYQIFPKHVADALKAGKKVEPENHELVTIFFSDIVGFTDISRTLSPMKVSALLDRLYLMFDNLAGKHGVFKVETIGDAYMGVTNLDNTQKDDHVKRIAQFALEVMDSAENIQIDVDHPERGCVKIRVGFHSGPVVSNVIGSLNPRYGLFGDTVNTASRMESNSVCGRIHCSEASALLLKAQAPEIKTKKRGKIQVKGKGMQVTYWVQRQTKQADGIDRDSHHSHHSHQSHLQMNDEADAEQSPPAVEDLA